MGNREKLLAGAKQCLYENGYADTTAPYVLGGQKLAKGNRLGLIPRSQRQIWMRNLFIRLLPHLPWKGLVAGGVQKASNAIALPDHERLLEEQMA